MAKKCIPGIICIENMTMFLMLVSFILILYFYYILVVKIQHIEKQSTTPIILDHGISTRNIRNPSVIMDPYGPPLRNDGVYFPPDAANIEKRGIPINIETRGLSSDYTQLGILTKQKGSEPLILPLMGRRLVSGLDKWQYYTISNTGNMNTKLPVSLKGRSCSGEYGCDSINNSDMVYVEGYNDVFRVTVYENSRFNYIPFI